MERFASIGDTVVPSILVFVMIAAIAYAAAGRQDHDEPFRRRFLPVLVLSLIAAAVLGPGIEFLRILDAS